MTDAVETTPDTAAIIKRRLVGLIVLLIFAFVLSLLLKARPNAPDKLPSVVIPLGGSSPSTDATQAAAAAPLLDEPDTPTELAEPKPSHSQPPSRPAVAKPVEAVKPPKPVPEKPAAVATGKSATTPVKPTAPAKTPPKPEVAARWFVAVGAYKDPMAAQAIVSRVKQAGFGAASVAITSAGEKLHRVRAGPFASKPDAESARATLIVEGLTKAVVLSEK